MEPILRWTGNKRWHVPMMARLWAKAHSDNFIELFAGGAAISFGLEVPRALLNDSNPHLINFYRWVQRGNFPFDLAQVHNEELYYDYRAWFNDLVASGHGGSLEAAQLFYYLNRHGFNGLCRFNASGEFNVPFRPKKRGETQQFDVLSYQKVMTNWGSLNADFRAVDIDFNATDFVYADPPYDSAFGGYTSEGFSQLDQQQLAERLQKHAGPVVLMNAATKFIVEMYHDLGYQLTMLESGQQMHRKTGSGEDVVEVMATNFPVDAHDIIESRRD